MIRGKIIELCSTFNHGRFLSAMIDAAFSAERPPDFLFVVDDCSTDHSREVLERKQMEYPNLIVRYNPQNRGALCNVEEMLAEVDCDYCVLRSADDRDSPQLLRAAEKHLDEHPQAAFFGTDVAYFVADDGAFVREPSGVSTEAVFVAPDRFSEDFGGNLVHGAGIVFRTSAIRAIGGFPARYAWHSDWFVVMMLAFRYGFVYDPIVGAEVFLNPSSYNSVGNKNLKEVQSVYAAMVEALREPANAPLYECFRRHAVFDVMGARFPAFLKNHDGGRSENLTNRWGDEAIRNQRQRIGIPAVVRSAIGRLAPVIKDAKKFIVYGAGLQAEIVLDALVEHGLAAPSAIVVTGVPSIAALKGIPVVGLGALEDLEGTVVLTASKSYEGEMVQLARQKLRRAQILTIWGTYPCAVDDGEVPLRADSMQFVAFIDEMIARGEVTKARAVLEKSLQDDMRNAFALCRLGMLDFRDHRFSSAIDRLRRSLEMGSQSPETHLFLGLSYLATGYRAEAVAALAQGIVLHPPYCHDVLKETACVVDSKGFQTVSDAFVEAAAIASENAEIIWYHGRFLCGIKEFSAALGPLRKAMARRPACAMIRYELGIAECAVGNIDAAIRSCQEAIYLDALFPERERLFGLLLPHYNRLTAYIETVAAGVPELRMMIADLFARHDVYTPSQCWLFHLLLNCTQIQRDGLENFKNTVNRNYFGWVPGQIDDQINALERLFPERATVFGEQRPPWTPSAWSVSDWEKYARFMHLLWRFAQKEDKLSFLENIEEPSLGHPLAITIDGRMVSQDLGNSCLDLNSALSRLPADRHDSLSVCELGAGYGRLPFLLLARYPKIRVTIIDIPPALFLSQWYLTQCYPEIPAFKFRAFSSYNEIADEFQNARLRFVASYQSALLPKGSFDLFITVATLQEMTLEQVGHWIGEIDRLTIGWVYLKQWTRYYDDLNKVRIDREDYPIPRSWQELFSRTCPVQTKFFESCYQVGHPSAAQVH